MFYVFVNTEAPLNGQNAATSKQTSKQDVLMDGGKWMQDNMLMVFQTKQLWQFCLLACLVMTFHNS